MSLSELEALAKATLVNPHGGYPYELYMPYITAATPERILQMIALIRQLGDVVTEYSNVVEEHRGVYYNVCCMTAADLPHDDDCTAMKALNALKEFK